METEPIPTDLDDTVTRLVHAYKAGADKRKQLFPAASTPRERGILSVYAERMASLARRPVSIEPLIDAIVALGMAFKGVDREGSLQIMRRLAIPCDAAARIGIDHRFLFAQGREYVSADVGQVLMDFARRSAEKRSLRAMYFEERSRSRRIRYVPSRGVPR